MHKKESIRDLFCLSKLSGVKFSDEFMEKLKIKKINGFRYFTNGKFFRCQIYIEHFIISMLT